MSEQLLPYALTTVARVKDLLFDANRNVTTTGNTALNSANIAAVASITNLAIGQPISGLGIPAGTTITGLATGVIAMSHAATATNTGVVLTVINQPIAFDSVIIRLINSVTDYFERECDGRRFFMTTYNNDVYSVSGTKQHYLVLRQAPVFYAVMTGDTTTGSAVITNCFGIEGILPGMPISGDGIVPGPINSGNPVTVTAVDLSAKTVTISNAAVANVTAGNQMVYGIYKLEYRAGTPSTPGWTKFILDQFELIDNGKAGVIRVYGVMPRLYNNMVRASYSAGYLIDWTNAGNGTTHTLPSDISRTIENLVVRWFKRRDSPGKSGETLAGTTINWNKLIDAEDMDVIKHYRRAPIIM